MQEDEDAGLFGSFQEGFQLRIFSLLQGVVVGVINALVAAVINFAGTVERHTTTTAFIDSVTFKLTLFYFLNSFVVPIVTIAGQEDTWCAPDAACLRVHRCHGVPCRTEFVRLF